MIRELGPDDAEAYAALRGYRVARIGTLEHWEPDADGYARATTDTDGPWPDPAWCP